MRSSLFRSFMMVSVASISACVLAGCSAAANDDTGTTDSELVKLPDNALFECTTDFAIDGPTDASKKEKQTGKFVLLGINEKVVSYGYLDQESEDNDIVVSAPEDQWLGSLNENYVARQFKSELVLAADSDGFYFPELHLNKASGLTKGTFVVRPGAIDESITAPVTCKVKPTDSKGKQIVDLNALVDAVGDCVHNGSTNIGKFDTKKFSASAVMAKMRQDDSESSCKDDIYYSSSREDGAKSLVEQLNQCDSLSAVQYDQLLEIINDPTNLAVFASEYQGDDSESCSYYQYEVYRADGTVLGFYFDFTT